LHGVQFRADQGGEIIASQRCRVGNYQQDPHVMSLMLRKKLNMGKIQIMSASH